MALEIAMKAPTVAAATLMAARFFVHVFDGGPETNAPIRGGDLPEVARATTQWSDTGHLQSGCSR